MFIVVTIIIPIILGLIIPLFRFNDKSRSVYVILSSIFTSISILLLILFYGQESITFIKLTDVLSIGFKLDDLSKHFLLILLSLWPLATIYASEYMEMEDNRDTFFKYYLIAYGIAIGVAVSRNLITMYLFYELLTFLTLPLIMHKMDQKSLFAGKVYLVLSILGASLALMGIVIYVMQTHAIEFTSTGLIDRLNNVNNRLIYISYILCFIGFGVKAAIIPFTVWLPLCSVAPTPVSALLHAVAVVKAGVFAVIRVTYYSFGINILYGSKVSYIASCIAIATILYGSIMAVRDKHIKRRLAYSTASNLSYILFVVTLLTREGLAAGLTHMMFHAIIKINLFFAAGSMMIYGKSEYVSDVKGLSSKMPITSFSFLIASLALIGIPMTCGFVSKYEIITAAISSKSVISYIGIIAIVISSILTLIYLFSIVINIYVPDSKFDSSSIENVNESRTRIKIVLIIITFLIIYFGINSSGVLDFINCITKSL